MEKKAAVPIFRPAGPERSLFQFDPVTREDVRQQSRHPLLRLRMTLSSTHY
jgi:hypothetical protein